MVRCEVLVVGGGPAGSTVARYLSRAGVKVILVEKEKLPRFKLCAGCISVRAEPLLPPGWKRQVLSEIKGGLLGFRGRSYVEVSSERPVAYIVERSSFDSYLAEEAVSSGAELWEGVEFIGFEEGKAITSAGKVKADIVVGADGFYTKVGRFLGYKKMKFFRSLEFWEKEDIGERVVIDIGLVRRGYAWIFPKGDEVSVGVASSGKEDLLRVLKDYASKTPYLREKSVGRPFGWMIPFAEKEEDLQLGKGRVALVGDAANMVDPLLGEGIYYSLLGGKLLAEAILESQGDFLEAYRRKVRKEILPQLSYAGKMARIAYRFQRLAFGMGEKAVSRFLDLLTGKKTYKDLYRRGLFELLLSPLHFENFLHIIIDKILERR